MLLKQTQTIQMDELKRTQIGQTEKFHKILGKFTRDENRPTNSGTQQNSQQRINEYIREFAESNRIFDSSKVIECSSWKELYNTIFSSAIYSFDGII